MVRLAFFTLGNDAGGHLFLYDAFRVIEHTVKSDVGEFDGDEYDTHDRGVHSPIEDISRKVLHVKRLISTRENSTYNTERK